MIFFGIRNYYKHDSVFRLDECEACGERNQLHSYNTLRCAHVYWIPFFPVGRKRILRYCPVCKHHGEMSIAAWKEKREREMLPLLQTARGVGSKHVDVGKLLRLLNEVGTRDEFLSVAPRLRTDATAETGWLGMLAETYARFGEREAALDVLSVQDGSEGKRGEGGEGAWISGFAESRFAVPSPPDRREQTLPLLIAPCLLVMAIGFAGMISFGAQAHVFIVSGIQADYPVLIDGESHVASADDPADVSLSFGTHRIEPADETSLFEPFSVTLSASVLQRLTDDDAFVINPDRAALLVAEQVGYYPEDESPSDTDNLEVEYYAGEQFYVFRDIDYRFVDPDEEISITSDGVTIREYVDVLTDGDPDAIVSLLAAFGKTESARAFGRAALDLYPDDGDLVMAVAEVEDLGTMIELLSTRLEQRPVLIEWHRAYQSLMPAFDPDHDLVDEYRARLGAEPSNKTLRYLLGRIVRDDDEALNHFTVAASEPDPVPHAFHAIGHYHKIRGSFERAFMAADRAEQLRPESWEFEAAGDDLQLASGRLDDLIFEWADVIESNGPSPVAIASLTFLYAATGDSARALEFMNEYVDSIDEATDSIYIENAIGILTAYAEGTGNTAQFVELARRIDHPFWQFRAALAAGSLDDAATWIGGNDRSATFQHLLMYAAASAAGESELGASELSFAISALEAGRMEDRELAVILRDQKPRSLESMYRLVPDVDDLTIAFAAAGFRIPDEQAAYHRQARTLNYDKRFPGFVLDRILDTSRR